MGQVHRRSVGVVMADMAVGVVDGVATVLVMVQDGAVGAVLDVGDVMAVRMEVLHRFPAVGHVVDLGAVVMVVRHMAVGMVHRMTAVGMVVNHGAVVAMFGVHDLVAVRMAMDGATVGVIPWLAGDVRLRHVFGAAIVSGIGIDAARPRATVGTDRRPKPKRFVGIRMAMREESLVV